MSYEEKDHLLLEAWIELRPESAFVLPAGHGQRMMAVLLYLVREQDEDLSTRLHDAAGEKPYTVSMLGGEFELASPGHVRLSPEKVYRFRVTSIDPHLSQMLIQGVFPCLEGREIQIGEGVFRVLGVESSVETLADIYRRHMVEDIRDPARVGMVFHSPTAFRSSGRNFLFPEPRLVWLSLNRSWGSVSRVDLGKDLHEEAAREIFVTRYELRTSILHFDRYRQVGFSGHCEYVISPEEQWKGRIYSLLLDFSRYSGLGMKKTMGMGQVEPVFPGARSTRSSTASSQDD